MVFEEGRRILFTATTDLHADGAAGKTNWFIIDGILWLPNIYLFIERNRRGCMYYVSCNLSKNQLNDKSGVVTFLTRHFPQIKYMRRIKTVKSLESSHFFRQCARKFPQTAAERLRLKYVGRCYPSHWNHLRDKCVLVRSMLFCGDSSWFGGEMIKHQVGSFVGDLWMKVDC